MKCLKNRFFFFWSYNFNGQIFKNHEISLFVDHRRIFIKLIQFQKHLEIVEIRFDVWVYHQFNDEDNKLVKLLLSFSWKFLRSIWFENIYSFQVCIFTHNDSWFLWNEIRQILKQILYFVLQTKISDQLTEKSNLAKIVVCSRSQGSYFRWRPLLSDGLRHFRLPCASPVSKIDRFDGNVDWQRSIAHRAISG